MTIKVALTTKVNIIKSPFEDKYQQSYIFICNTIQYILFYYLLLILLVSPPLRIIITRVSLTT